MGIQRSISARRVRRQRGIALIVSLVVLLVMSMLGISSMQGTLLEERMAGNLYDRNLAFQAAEAALRAGEADAGAGLNIAFDAVGTAVPDVLADDANWPAGAVEYDTDLAGLAVSPEYIIERQQPLPPLVADQPMQPPLMRITARGTGRNGTSVVVLQSIYKP
jgi:type IV pilus assembly protein PilX